LPSYVLESTAGDNHGAAQVSDESPDLPAHRLWQPTTAKWFTVVFGASLAYAVVRYHLAGDVEWRHLPLFILNKAASLAAVVFVACSYLIGKVIHWHDDDKALRLVVVKFCGLMGFFLACVHALFSLCLLSPAYYAKYFDDGGRLSLQGELAMAVGVVALFFLLSPAITTLPMMPKALGGVRWKRAQRAGYVSLLLVVCHLVVLGWKGWLAPRGWEGGLPPISLVAVLVALAPLIVKRRLLRQ
jgi:DMSO/TMAO reductase YedYZ heme-binding membrane subunit